VLGVAQRDKFDPLYQRLIDALIKERKARGLTQIDVAGRMGTDQSQISKFERFERRLDIIDFVRYCRAIEIDAPDFLRQLIT
jgi:transcriptional regulator with XRE-family HTH domain